MAILTRKLITHEDGDWISVFLSKVVDEGLSLFLEHPLVTLAAEPEVSEVVQRESALRAPVLTLGEHNSCVHTDQMSLSARSVLVAPGQSLGLGPNYGPNKSLL